MPATVTLSSTSLELTAKASDTQVKVASTSGLIPGLRLFVDGELMSVVSLGVSPWVNVRRGVDGTSAQDHYRGAVAWIGRADQFYFTDPAGSPPPEIPVSPYINAANGSLWFAQGDNIPGKDQSFRWWQKQTTTYGQGALGVRTITTDPSSSS